MLSELCFWTVSFYWRQTWQREVWYSYSIEEPKKHYLKKRARGGCFLICKIISRHYKKSNSHDRGSFMNSSRFALIVCPLFGNPSMSWKNPSYAHDNSSFNFYNYFYVIFKNPISVRWYEKDSLETNVHCTISLAEFDFQTSTIEYTIYWNKGDYTRQFIFLGLINWLVDYFQSSNLLVLPKRAVQIHIKDWKRSFVKQSFKQ